MLEFGLKWCGLGVVGVISSCREVLEDLRGGRGCMSETKDGSEERRKKGREKSVRVWGESG